MAQEMDDLEFLLPSELLTDDDLLTGFHCGFGNSSGLSSDLTSPVESVTGPLENGSDEDDVVAELTRKLTRSGLRDSNMSCDCTTKGLTLSGSPQSTLFGFKLGSRGSPNSDSRSSSPPAAKNALSWDMLYAAAEEVARIRMVEDSTAFHSNEMFAAAHKPGPVTITQPKTDPGTRFYPIRSLNQTQISYHQPQAARLQLIKQNQLMMMKNGVMGQGDMEYQLRDFRRDDGGDRAYSLSMSAWPTLSQSQQQTSSGMKTVFLGESGPKKERVGTGVFMPRRFDPNPIEFRKKPGFSSNPIMDPMDAHFQRNGVGSFTPDYEALLKQRNNYLPSPYQGRSIRPQPVMNQELRLPQEWTY